MIRYFFIFLLIFGCNSQKLNWYKGSLEDAFALSDDKIIMIDFYTDWCAPCKLLDSDTFTNEEVIQYIDNNFIPIKINAESEYGMPLYEKFKGTGYPMIIFLDKEKNEIDRFYGFYPPNDFILKLNNILSGDHTFPDLLTKYKLGDNSSSTIFELAKKYFSRGEYDDALQLYEKVLENKDLSYNMFHETNYSIGMIKLKNNESNNLEKYIRQYPESFLLKQSIINLLMYYKFNFLEKKELDLYNKYIDRFSNDPLFLNQYSWRMTELNINLDNALQKINLSLSLIENDDKNQAMINDTKAEVYWKLGKVDKAIITINESISIDPDNQYYINQKEKFLNSIN
jgi:thioredoxin-related protein|tara:strand:+ start:540 stop:1562 length:1023 start_codon:yes stop_codon:yes gene_type:complete